MKRLCATGSLIASAGIAAALVVILPRPALCEGAGQVRSDTPAAKGLSGGTAGEFNPGDAVRISSAPDTAAIPNGIYHIDGDGCILLPIVGRTRISNLTEEQLVSMLKTSFVEQLRFPNVQARPLIRVSALGGFTKPGLYYIDPSNSLWDVVRIAGGTLREDGLRKLQWERDRKPVVKDLIPLLQSGGSLDKIGFRSGDQIWVTSRPKQRAWDVVRGDVIPLVSLLISTATTSITLYQFYKLTH